MAVIDPGELYSCSIDGAIRMWDLTTNKHGARLAGHTDQVTSLLAVPTPGGSRIISGSKDATVKVWRKPRKAGKAKKSIRQLLKFT